MSVWGHEPHNALDRLEQLTSDRVHSTTMSDLQPNYLPRIVYIVTMTDNVLFER